METTSVVIAQSKSKSLRTTIPAGIARQFNIDETTQLSWEIEARDNELRIVVRPSQQLRNIEDKRLSIGKRASRGGSSEKGH